MTARDDFLAATIRTLASRAGHRCSNPQCLRPTSGPGLNENKSVNVGEAAHITAAARGGKRYDDSLTPEARRAPSNGIWLCELCAKLIDTDEQRFTVEVLRKWKKDAEDRALLDIATAAPGTYRRPLIVVELDEGDRAFLQSLGLSPEDNVDAVFERVLPAATIDIAAFRSAKEWPAHTIALNLTLRDEWRQPVMRSRSKAVANGLDAAEPLNVVSPPGTGKTTTLVQLAGSAAAGPPNGPRVSAAGRMVGSARGFLYVFDATLRLRRVPRAALHATGLPWPPYPAAGRMERARSRVARHGDTPIEGASARLSSVGAS